MEHFTITIKIWTYCYLFVRPFYWVIKPECDFEGENFWDERDIITVHRNDMPKNRDHATYTTIGRYYRSWLFVEFLCFKFKIMVWRVSWAGKKFPSGYDARIHTLIKTDDQ